MPSPLGRVYDNIRTGQMVVRDAARMREIVSVLARHGFGALVQEMAASDRWIARKLAELRTRRAAVESLPLERRIVHAIQELGPTFVKFGQMLSTRPDLVPAALMNELQTLQDRVPPMPENEVRGVIENELGRPVEELFARFRSQPLASASIAQVHRASLRGAGIPVVVKVQRPGIASRIEADLEIMMWLARAAEAAFPQARLFSPAGMVREFERAILQEIDFTIERSNLERFRENFRSRPRVVFPQPYPSHSARRVLTMDYLEGVKITEIDPEKHDVEEIVRTGLDAVFKMIYEDGFFHGDLHPGNLLVRSDGAVCFLDCGLCGRLSRRQRDVLTDMMLAVTRQDFEGLARILWRVGIHGPDSTRDYGAFEADVAARTERWFAGKKMAEIEFGHMFTDLIQIALEHRIRMPTEFTMVFKAIVTIEGVGKQLQPDLDLISAVRPYARRVLAERYRPRRLLEFGYALVRDLSDMLGSAPQTLESLAVDVRAGRARIPVEVREVESLRRTYDRAQQRYALSLLAAAAALCGTLALDHGTPVALGVPALSAAFYLVAAACGAAFVLETFRR